MGSVNNCIHISYAPGCAISIQMSGRYKYIFYWIIAFYYTAPKELVSGRCVDYTFQWNDYDITALHSLANKHAAEQIDYYAG